MAVGAAAAAAVFAVGWAAATAVSAPSAAPTETDRSTIVVARSGELEERRPVRVSLVWPAVPAARNAAAGTVTEVVVTLSTPTLSGDIVYRVQERPVVVIDAAIPWYRDLTGGERGRDVEALQRLLAAQGLLAAPPDGRYGPATVSAVRRWQEALGVPVSGVVGRGDVIVVPDLPAALRPAAALQVGSVLAGSEVALDRLPDLPLLELVLPPDDTAAVPAGAAVEVDTGEGALTGVLRPGVERADEDAGTTALVYPLVTPAGQPLCDDRCTRVAIADETVSLSADVVLVPRTTGVVVPVAALTTEGAALTVRTAGGDTLTVTVTVTSRGLALVEGVPDGTELLLPDGPDPEPPTAEATR